jgi:uncharacterized coiled-coil protein SlyX
MGPHATTGIGCGTLLVIALIVLLLGNLGGRDVEKSLATLEAEVRALRATVQAQSDQLKLLRASLASESRSATQPSSDVHTSPPGE